MINIIIFKQTLFKIMFTIELIRTEPNLFSSVSVLNSNLFKFIFLKFAKTKQNQLMLTASLRIYYYTYQTKKISKYQ